MLGYIGLIDTIKNDLSSHLRMRTMFEILANLTRQIFSPFSWNKIIDENEDNKDNESDL